jgi:uncharacterized integral membrane protein
MKLISGIFALIILAAVLSFALSNRQNVSVGLWPLDGAMASPLYAIGLAPLVFGLVFGGLWGWLGSMPHRLRARRLNKELTALNDKIGEMQRDASAQPTKVKGQSGFWRFK